MSLFNIPGMDGIKTAVAGWAQIIGAFLFALTQLVQLVADCLNGVTALDACIDRFPALVAAVVVAANGLGYLGVGDKIEKLKASLTN